MNEESYLGDGVYASFDGYQIWLRADDNHIAVEPAVWQRLKEYVHEIGRRTGEGELVDTAVALPDEAKS